MENKLDYSPLNNSNSNTQEVQEIKKTLFSKYIWIAIIVTLVAFLAFPAIYFFSHDRSKIAPIKVDEVRKMPFSKKRFSDNSNKISSRNTTPLLSPSLAENNLDKKMGSVADVKGAAKNISLGFNNAEQIESLDDQYSWIVWVAGKKLQLAKRNKEGEVIRIKTISQGEIVLPAIAANPKYMGVAWVERNGMQEVVKASISQNAGEDFENPILLGQGSGVSLAANNEEIVAVWHDGKENTSSRVMFSIFKDGTWSAPIRVDSSTRAAIWASVFYKNDHIYVTWRDNRKGVYNVWFRISQDGGKTWGKEQQLTTVSGGDPDICVDGNNFVWIAYHTQAQIFLIRSRDNGASFEQPQKVGNGWFAHLSCTEKFVAVGWEATNSSPQSRNKDAGWAIFNTDGIKITGENIKEGETAATTVYLTPNNNLLEILWIKISGDNPLVGTLRHKSFKPLQ